MKKEIQIKSTSIGKKEIQPFLFANDITEYIGSQSVY